MAALLASKRADAGARLGWLFLANDAADLVEGRLLQAFLLKRRAAGEQLIQEHSQRVDVAAGVDVEARHLRLLGAHVQRRADHLREARKDRLLA